MGIAPSLASSGRTGTWLYLLGGEPYIWDSSKHWATHYSDVIMGAISSQITSLTIVNSTVYSGADQRKYKSSASLAFVRGIHWGPVAGEFPAQMVSNAENVSIWWRHHDKTCNRLGFCFVCATTGSGHISMWGLYLYHSGLLYWRCCNRKVVMTHIKKFQLLASG